jgi:hypothetical protein
MAAEGQTSAQLREFIAKCGVSGADVDAVLHKLHVAGIHNLIPLLAMKNKQMLESFLIETCDIGATHTTWLVAELIKLRAQKDARQNSQQVEQLMTFLENEGLPGQKCVDILRAVGIQDISQLIHAGRDQLLLDQLSKKCRDRSLPHVQIKAFIELAHRGKEELVAQPLPAGDLVRREKPSNMLDFLTNANMPHVYEKLRAFNFVDMNLAPRLTADNLRLTGLNEADIDRLLNLFSRMQFLDIEYWLRGCQLTNEQIVCVVDRGYDSLGMIARATYQDLRDCGLEKEAAIRVMRQAQKVPT